MQALWVSAKGAVDDELVQSAFEEGELLIIELGDEQLGDPAGVDGRRFTDCSWPRAFRPILPAGGRVSFSRLTNGPSSRLRRNTTSFSRGSLLSKSTRTARRRGRRHRQVAIPGP
jgi:hypothetical protein